MIINIIFILILSKIFNISLEASSTMCVISNATIGFFLLHYISKPFNLMKKTLFVSMILLFLIQIILFNELFSLVILKPVEVICLLLVLMLSTQFFKYFFKLYTYILKKQPKWFN